MKKENFNYYDNFINSTNYAYEEMKLIKEYFKNFNADNASEIENKVHYYENEADKVLHNSLNYLVRDFIPPIDREDIINLLHQLDDVVDCVDEIAIDVNIYNIEHWIKNKRPDIEFEKCFPAVQELHLFD